MMMAFYEKHQEQKHGRSTKHCSFRDQRQQEAGIPIPSESEEESDNEFSEAVNPEFNKDFHDALKAIKNSNPKDLQNEKFFRSSYKSEKKDIYKPLTFKEYELNMTLRGGEATEEGDNISHSRFPTPDSQVLKSDCKVSFDDGLDDGDCDDDLVGGFLKKVAQEKHDQEASGNKRGSFRSTPAYVEQLRGPSSEDAEEWLNEYFADKRFDEEELKRQYESGGLDEEHMDPEDKYKQSFQKKQLKIGQLHPSLVRHPRVIRNSVRLEGPSKSRQYKKLRKERKRELFAKKVQEVRRQQAAKMNDILDMVKKIKEVSGSDSIGIEEEDILEDFDPEKYDSAMNKAFGEEYYDDAGHDGSFQPDEDYEDSEQKKDCAFGEDDDVAAEQCSDPEDYPPDGSDSDHISNNNKDLSEQNECLDLEDPDFNMDCDYDPEAAKAVKVKKERLRGRRGRSSTFEEAMKKLREMPRDKRKRVDKFFDDLYALEFEDIAGGIPCRFKYRQVEPNSFGLTVEEILQAPDSELNSWYSLKKLIRYDRTREQERRDARRMTQKAENETYKRRILPSLYDDSDTKLQAEMERKRKRNLKKSLRKKRKLEREKCQGLPSEGNDFEMSGITDVLESKSLHENEGEEPGDKDSDALAKTGGLLEETDTVSKQSGIAELDTTPSSKMSGYSASLHNVKDSVKKKKLTTVQLHTEGSNESANAHVHNSDFSKTEINSVASPSEDRNGKSMRNIRNVTGKGGDATDSGLKHTNKEARRYKTKPRSLPPWKEEIAGIPDDRLLAYGFNPSRIKRALTFKKLKNAPAE